MTEQEEPVLLIQLQIQDEARSDHVCHLTETRIECELHDSLLQI